MNKSNPICDVHMYPKKPNVEFMFLWQQFLGGIMWFHLNGNYSSNKSRVIKYATLGSIIVDWVSGWRG
jgi:hypothetical protein